jgi:hypothetical protein
MRLAGFSGIPQKIAARRRQTRCSTKKGGVPERTPRGDIRTRRDRTAGRVSLRGGGFRDFRDLDRIDLPLAATERLDVELGELLGADSIVILDELAQPGRQSLALGENRPELLRILGRPSPTLPRFAGEGAPARPERRGRRLRGTVPPVYRPSRTWRQRRWARSRLGRGRSA